MVLLGVAVDEWIEDELLVIIGPENEELARFIWQSQ